jgi:hypothetical protein
MQQGSNIHWIMQWRVKSMICAEITLLHYAIDSEISLLHNAAERSQILPLYHAAWSQIWVQRVRSKTLGGSLGP